VVRLNSLTHHDYLTAKDNTFENIKNEKIWNDGILIFFTKKESKLIEIVSLSLSSITL